MPEGDKRSPYHLSSNDKPGNIITHVQLKGDNYEEWARIFKGSLRAKMKTGFIDGTISRPTEPDALDEWHTVNSMIVSWILNTIESNLRSTITYVDEAKTLWDELNQRFSLGNGPKVHQIKYELANCTQRGDSVATYFGRIKKLWDKENDFDQFPVCSCNGCKCDISGKLDRKREEERVHQFLMGLTGTLYNTVRSNILGWEPLPTLNRVYSLIIQEEQVRNMDRVTETKPDPMSFVVRGSNKTRETKETKQLASVVCSHCRRTGHDKESCFLLVGFPEWWGDKPRSCSGRSGKG